MNVSETIKTGGAFYTDVGRHKCVQYTLENRITAEAALIYKKGI
jgi:hypothetical protein